jgi:HEAT repeat protein
LIPLRNAAPAVAAAAAGCGARLTAIEPDDERAQAEDVEFCRAVLFALVRLGNYDALASVALDAQGEPVARWWPVAFALQRIGDRRAASALATLAGTPGVYTASFALRGLAAAKDARTVGLAAPIAQRPDADVKLRVAAVRALGQVGGRAAVDALLAVLKQRSTPLTLAIEATTALGVAADPRSFAPLLEMFTDPVPALRAAALTSAAKVDPDGFLLVLSSFGHDKDWSVRIALAGVLASFPGEVAGPALDDVERLRVYMEMISNHFQELLKANIADLT